MGRDLQDTSLNECTIAIIDDHGLFVAGLELVLTRLCPGLSIRSYNRPDEFLKQAADGLEFDLVILDFFIPGHEARVTIESIRDYDNDIPIILLTSSISQADRSEAFSAGATEFIQKHTDPEKLLEILQSTISGSHVMGEAKFSEFNRPEIEGITQRQLEIMIFVAKGFSNKEAARLLDISPETVKSHLKEVFLRFGLRNRMEVGEFLRSRGVG